MPGPSGLCGPSHGRLSQTAWARKVPKGTAPTHRTYGPPRSIGSGGVPGSDRGAIRALSDAQGTQGDQSGPVAGAMQQAVRDAPAH